jgi:hypothetical protein
MTRYPVHLKMQKRRTRRRSIVRAIGAGVVKSQARRQR